MSRDSLGHAGCRARRETEPATLARGQKHHVQATRDKRAAAAKAAVDGEEFERGGPGGH